MSVVIPLYNKAPFIARTLEAVVQQTLAPAEIIVVDDSSTDGCAAIVAEFIGRYAGCRIRLVPQLNAGPGPARNRGIAEARSEWTALLDGDDVWSPIHLQTLAEIAEAFPAADVLSTSFARIGSQDALPAYGEATNSHTAHRLDYFDASSETARVWSSSVALRRSVVLKSGGFGAFWPGEDAEYWLRLALDHQFAVSTSCTAYYVQGTGGLMEQHEESGGGGRMLQPIHSTIAQALTNPKYADKQSALRLFRADLLRRNIRQALFRSSPADARFFHREMVRHGETATLLDRMLMRLPAPALSAGLAVRRTMRRP